MRQEVLRLVKIHMVKKGDTLYEIAKKHGVTVEELLKLNPGITNPDAIDVGMKVKIPSSMPKPPAGDWLHQHKVVQGDTLWKLAKAWGIQLSDMIKANPQLKNPNVLLTGEIVNIPKAAGSAETPMPMPEGPELQHLMSETPVPGKTFTGPIAGKADTAPIPLPTPVPAPVEGKTPTAPIVQPMPTPLPAPVPIPLPHPMPPVMEKPKPAYPAPPIHQEAVDLFKHYPVPAVEAFVPFEMPKHPGAVMGQAEMPYPGLMQPHGMMPTAHPCPPGTMPIGEWGGYGMPSALPQGGLQAGLHADFHADVHADLHAHAGAGAFGMMPASWEGAGMPMPGMPGMPYGGQLGMMAAPHEMPYGHGGAAPHEMPYGHGAALHEMPYGHGAAPMPMGVAGMPYGTPYGMPAPGYMEPMMQGGATGYPTGGKPCNCGCQDRQGRAVIGQAQEAGASQADSEEQARRDSVSGSSAGASRKDSKKAVIRSAASGSGSASRREKKRKARSGKSNPWINR